MENEPSRSDGEPVMLPITDFVVENIDDLRKLNPDKSFMRDESFRQSLAEAIASAESFKSAEKEECDYYIVHLKPTINARPVGFTLKVLRSELDPNFEEIIEEYEILANYCPRITLPTIFLSTSTAGSSKRNLSIQREIKNGMTIEDYLQTNRGQGIKIKPQLVELYQGLSRLFHQEGTAVDDRTLDPMKRNVLIDPATGRLWIVDNNHLIPKPTDEQKQVYEKKLASLKKYIDNLN